MKTKNELAIHILAMVYYKRDYDVTETVYLVSKLFLLSRSKTGSCAGSLEQNNRIPPLLIYMPNAMSKLSAFSCTEFYRGNGFLKIEGEKSCSEEPVSSVAREKQCLDF